MSLRLIVLSSVLVGLCAVLLTADCFASHRATLYRFVQEISVQIWAVWGYTVQSVLPSSEEVVLGREELSHYDGMKGSKGLYLAILGKVFDVSRGKQHYGPGGGYHFFTGKDASRAFVTGNFKPDGLTDDVSNLTPQDILSLEEWLQFYEKDYKYVGKVSGRFYTKEGKPTKDWINFKTDLKHARKVKSAENEDSKRFPPCNSEWKQGAGGRVFCSKMSGGISRDWVGVPRMYHQPGKNKARCACVRNSGPPTDAKEGSSLSNRGDLDNPNMKEYANCPPNSESCSIPEH